MSWLAWRRCLGALVCLAAMMGGTRGGVGRQGALPETRWGGLTAVRWGGMLAVRRGGNRAVSRAVSLVVRIAVLRGETLAANLVVRIAVLQGETLAVSLVVRMLGVHLWAVTLVCLALRTLPPAALLQTQVLTPAVFGMHAGMSYMAHAQSFKLNLITCSFNSSPCVPSSLVVV